MGGENIKKKENQVLFQYLRDKKKKKRKKEGGSEKGGGGGGGVNVHPFHLPWIRAWYR